MLRLAQDRPWRLAGPDAGPFIAGCADGARRRARGLTRRRGVHRGNNSAVRARVGHEQPVERHDLLRHTLTDFDGTCIGLVAVSRGDLRTLLGLHAYPCPAIGRTPELRAPGPSRPLKRQPLRRSPDPQVARSEVFRTLLRRVGQIPARGHIAMRRPPGMRAPCARPRTRWVLVIQWCWHRGCCPGTADQGRPPRSSSHQTAADS